MKDYTHYREAFPITEKYTFMNHAAVSPPPLRVLTAVHAFWEGYGREGIAEYPNWVKRVEEVRGLFARLIGSDPEEIAFTGNTSEGLGMVAAGLDWKNGEGVLVPVPEFPANIYPWMNLESRGISVTFIERSEGRIGVKAFEKALKPGTRIISLSSVDFATGFRCDLEAVGEFCRRKGLLFCVDAIQGLGVIPMDVRKNNIHFLSSGGHKWLLSSMGCGALFISKEVNPLLSPHHVGWKSVKDEENFFDLRFELKENALRFEPGTLNLSGIFALGAALELIQETGVADIYRQVLSLNDLIVEGLRDRRCTIRSPLGEKERSGIISFNPPADPKTLFHFLKKKNISVSLRGELIRLSPHFYNDEGDVSRFFEAMDLFMN